MLYYLFRFLEQYDIPGSHLWSYISFRALLALILSLIIAMVVGEFFIRWMKRRKLFEANRDPKIDPFGVLKPPAVPMGGIIIIVATLVPVLLLGRLRNVYLLLMIGTMVWLGLLGFADDYRKLTRGKDGIRGKWKLLGQGSIGFIVGLTLWLSPDAVVRENVNVVQQNQEVVVKHKKEAVKSLQTTIPFVKNHNLNYSEVLSCLGKNKVAAGWVIFVVITILVVMAVSNGANINDGMDGMCAGNSAIMTVALLILTYVSSHIVYAAYFDIMYIPGSEELVVFLAAFIGGLVGFLWYNAFPGQTYMGDTGSLTIGGIIGVCAVIIHKELLLFILCGVFLIESLSVIIQKVWPKIARFRGAKKMMLVFRSTPIHDTFRILDKTIEERERDGRVYLLRNWPKKPAHEATITIRFWIVSIILAALTIITLKIR